MEITEDGKISMSLEEYKLAVVCGSVEIDDEDGNICDDGCVRIAKQILNNND